MKARMFTVFVLVVGLALLLAWSVTAQGPLPSNGALEHAFGGGGKR